jgi:hypothetical protein
MYLLGTHRSTHSAVIYQRSSDPSSELVASRAGVPGFSRTWSGVSPKAMPFGSTYFTVSNRFSNVSDCATLFLTMMSRYVPPPCEHSYRCADGNPVKRAGCGHALRRLRVCACNEPGHANHSDAKARIRRTGCNTDSTLQSDETPNRRLLMACSASITAAPGRAKGLV